MLTDENNQQVLVHQVEEFAIAVDRGMVGMVLEGAQLKLVQCFLDSDEANKEQ